MPLKINERKQIMWQKIMQVSNGGSSEKIIGVLSLLTCKNPTSNSNSGSSSAAKPFQTTVNTGTVGWTSASGANNVYLAWEFESEKYVDVILITLNSATLGSSFEIQYRTNSNDTWESIPVNYIKTQKSYVFAIKSKCKYMRIFGANGFYNSNGLDGICVGGLTVYGTSI